MSINEAEILKSLNIGIKKEPTTDAVLLVFQSFNEIAVEKIQELLLNRGTGSLAQSVAFIPVKKSGDKYTLEIIADDYFDFVDLGVNGTRANHSAPYSFKKETAGGQMVRSIEEWNKTTGRTVPVRVKSQFKNVSYSIKTYRQLAIATAIAVKKKGIKPAKVRERVFGKDQEQQLSSALEKAIGKAIEVHFQTKYKQPYKSK